MKRIECVLLLVVVLIYACAEVTVRGVSSSAGTEEMAFYRGDKEIARKIRGKNGEIKTSGKVPDGIVKRYYKSGALLEEKDYKEGKAEGMSRVYFEDGTLSAENNFKNDKIGWHM